VDELRSGIILPAPGEADRKNGAESVRSRSDPPNIARHSGTAPNWDSPVNALRQHMINSLFCGEYPLEMRQSRRLKDSFLRFTERN
jgi:hypothetical protein